MQTFPPGAPAAQTPTMMPPLPPGWTEHKAPSGVPYYYNSETRQSTYTRPLPVMPPFPPTQNPAAASEPGSVASSSSKKKGKPKDKFLIPGTSWLKVITTDNLVFYMNKETKKSSWVVPDEIEDEVEAYEAEQRAQRIRQEEEARLKREEEIQAQQRERDRIRKELEAERKALKERQQREQEEERKRQAAEQERKRKAEAEEEGGNEDDEDARPTKAAKVDSGGEDDGDEADAEGQAGPVDEDDEEAWQKAVAAELAAEHAIANKEKKAQKAVQKEEQEAARQKVFNAPAKVDLTAEEGRALFKALLYEKNISPFAPWETSLPVFINDPRYVLLASQTARREVYEEYCREAARAKRLGKSVGSTAVNGASDSASPPAEDKKDPEKEYQALLKAEVKSTRLLWEDFRRAWKKDRRFFAFGKDDRQREKAFRQYQRELGERKRADAQRAESDFMELLKEKAGGLDPNGQPDWRDVKRPLASDPRYDAVGSSSLREELFKRYLKELEAKQRTVTATAAESEENAAARRAREKRERAEASIRERQQRVQGERAQMEREMQRSKLGASREEGERALGSLYVQAVREHDASWSAMLPALEADERFHSPALSMADKHRLFNAHLDSLARKRLDALHALFAQHAPRLDTPWEEVYPEIVDEFAVTRLKLSHDSLANKYASWQKVRFARAREDFDKLLGENSFVDFWGRMRNKRLDERLVEGIPGENEEEMIDDEEAGGRANLMEMAKQVDLREMHAVLAHDKRYRIFDHMEDEREQWMRDYLSNLAESTATVHRPQQA